MSCVTLAFGLWFAVAGGLILQLLLPLTAWLQQGLGISPMLCPCPRQNSFKVAELGVDGLYPDLSEVGVWPLFSARL